MTSDERVERVAKALFEVEHHPPGSIGKPFGYWDHEKLDPEKRRYWFASARAALAAAGPDVPGEVVEAAKRINNPATPAESAGFIADAVTLAGWLLSSCGEKP
jgi:hypothetical protein